EGDSAKGTMTAGGSPAGDWTATRGKDAKEPKESKDPSSPSTPSASSVTGAWSMTLQLDQVNATPSVTFKQDGEKLTGDYVSQQYGKFPLTGTVKGNDVNFSVTLNIEGNSIVGTYAGKIQTDGTISGAVDIGGMMSGTFTAGREQERRQPPQFLGGATPHPPRNRESGSAPARRQAALSAT